MNYELLANTTALKTLDGLTFDGTPDSARHLIHSIALAVGNCLSTLHPQHGAKELWFGEAHMRTHITGYISLDAKCVAGAADDPGRELLRNKVILLRQMLCNLIRLALGTRLSIYSNEIDPLTGASTISTPSKVFLSLHAEFVANSPTVIDDIDERVNRPLTARSFPELQQQLSDKKVAIAQQAATGQSETAFRLYRSFKSTIVSYGVHFNTVVTLYEHEFVSDQRSVVTLIDKVISWAHEHADLANSGFAHYIADTDGTANKIDGSLRGRKPPTPGQTSTWELVKTLRAHGEAKHKETHAGDAKWCAIHGWNATHETHPANGADGCMALSKGPARKKN
jgi:hypothetical protein